jgi:peptide/nickel transport system substrate-binding protein
LPLALAALASAGGPAAAQDYSEAPMLAERVEAGDLPPVAERLPAEPEVITPLESVGTYGGTLRRGLRGSSDHNNILRIMSPQGLTRWNREFTEVVPNVAASWSVSDDSTEYTFELRPGMRWSDGEPFTSEDVMFFVELLNDPDFYGESPPSRYLIEGERMQGEAIDEDTVKLTFAGPYGQFLEQLATPLGQEPVLWAKHYCQQFVPAYNDDVQSLVEAEGAADWVDLFRRKCGDLEVPARWGNPDRPTLDPWIVTDEAYTGDATRVVFERNPYFWQVDTEGQQLPYIDRLQFGVEQDAESLVLQVIAGEIDMQARHLDAAKNTPVFYENAERGGYEVYTRKPSNSNAMGFFFNQTTKDEALRDLFREKDFRVAMSLGIDREELIDLVWQGQGRPWQIGANEGTALYNEQLSTQFTEYDPERANELLDGLGLTERDAEGYRLLPDGERVSFGVDVIPTLQTEWVDAMELIVDYWRDLGIEATTNTMERTLYYERIDSNDFDVKVWTVSGGLDPTLDPRNVMAVHPQGSFFGQEWTAWYNSGGAQGEEPPQSMLDRYALFEEYKATADPARQTELFNRIHQIAADEFEMIGITTDADKTAIVSERLRNVPREFPSGWMYPDPGPTLPQQYYFAE